MSRASQLGVVRERVSQGEPCTNHCHPMVTAGTPKAALPKDQGQKLYTWAAGRGGWTSKK